MMKKVLIIGETGGIGAALAARLRGQGAEVTGLSRRDGFDLLDPETVEAQLQALSPGFDAILVASGALCSTRAGPEKSLRDLSGAEMAAQFAINTIGPALVLRHAPRLMPRKERAVFAALSARVGSIGDNRAGGWYSYRASKAALNQIIHTGAIELARTHRQAICVALHPGTVQTPFTDGYPCHAKVSPDAAAGNLISVLDGLDASETGGFFDYSGARVMW